MINICAKTVPRNLLKQWRDARLSPVFEIQTHYGDASATLLTLSRNFSNFFLFPQVKTTLAGNSFESTEDIQRSGMQVLKTSHKMRFRNVTKNGSTDYGIHNVAAHGVITCSVRTYPVI
jgi:hypothetical protein